MQVRAAPIAGVSSVSLVTPQAEYSFWRVHCWEMELLSVTVLQKERPIIVVPKSLLSQMNSRDKHRNKDMEDKVGAIPAAFCWHSAAGVLLCTSGHAMPSTAGRDPWQPRCPAPAIMLCRAVSQSGLAAASPQPLQEGLGIS